MRGATDGDDDDEHDVNPRTASVRISEEAEEMSTPEAGELPWEKYRWPEVETQWWPDEGGYFVARFTAYPDGVMADGESRDEAFANLLKAAVDWIGALSTWLTEARRALPPRPEES